jgi:hypothetical protein
MKTYLGFLALVGVLAFSILYLADRERKASVERLSDYKPVPQQSERNPYMRKRAQLNQGVPCRRSGPSGTLIFTPSVMSLSCVN